MLLGKNIGIDLGTANILVYVEGEGIITNEPSVIAFDYETNEVLATGTMAANMIGKGHHGIKIVSPLNQGVISDIEATRSSSRFPCIRLRTSISTSQNQRFLLCWSF